MGVTTNLDGIMPLTSEELSQRLRAAIEKTLRKRAASTVARQQLDGSRRHGLRQRHAAKLKRAGEGIDRDRRPA